MDGEIFVNEDSVSYEPPDPNTLIPETEPKDEKKEEKKPEEKAEEQKPEGEKPEEPEQPEKKAELPRGVQKRINKLTARNYGLKKELAERERQITELKAIADEKKLSDQIAEHTKKKPDKGEFDSYEDYIEAKSKWDVRSELLEQQKDKAEKPEEKKTEDRNEVVEEIFKAGSEAYEDFEEIVRKPDLKLSESMFLAALESDFAHEILYYLGTNPQEASKIYDLTPLQQAREIGKLETRITKEQPAVEEKEQKPLDVSEERKPEEIKKTTKAPPPIESVHGKSVLRKNPEKMTNEEYREHRGFDRRAWKKR